MKQTTPTSIHGRVATGVGFGRALTRLDWARAQFVAKLGIDPYPGTLNVIVDDAEGLLIWAAWQSAPGVRIENPGSGPRDCDARCYQVSILGGVGNIALPAAIVLPEVAGYAPGQIEIIAAVSLRDTLGLVDGDRVRIDVQG